jgi:hypothetical protein
MRNPILCHVATLPQTVAPVFGIAPSVETRDHHDLSSADREENDIGESAKKGLPDFALDDRESIGATLEYRRVFATSSKKSAPSPIPRRVYHTAASLISDSASGRRVIR